MQLSPDEKSKKIEQYVQSPHPLDAYLQVGYSCNAQCVMCEIWKTPLLGQTSILLEVIDKLSFDGFQWVTLWGGEPLLHPQIGTLMKAVKDKGMKLQIITNGSLLEKKAEEVCLYVDNLVVSLDSGIPLIHDTIRGKPRIYHQTIAGMKKILSQEHYPNLEIDCTLTNENALTLSSIVELSHQLGDIFIDFDPAQISGVGNNPSYALHVPSQSLDEAIELAQKYQIEITSPERIELIKKHLQGEPVIYPCYSYFKDLLINPFGEVYTCWTMGTIVGNILQSDFWNKWWENLEKNKEVLTGEHPSCLKCGFSHTRMPDAGLAHLVQQKNQRIYSCFD